jgi:hypothetical protein
MHNPPPNGLLNKHERMKEEMINRTILIIKNIIASIFVFPSGNKYRNIQKGSNTTKGIKIIVKLIKVSVIVANANMLIPYIP